MDTVDKTIEEFTELMVEDYGDLLPNPEHFPKTFKHYVDLYRYRHPEIRIVKQDE